VHERRPEVSRATAGAVLSSIEAALPQQNVIARSAENPSGIIEQLY
jgi:hypothetical protein